MSDNGDDVFTRLSGVIDDWGAHIAQSHEEISVQINVARGHLDRLLEAGADAAAFPDTDALESEIARLTTELDALTADRDQMAAQREDERRDSAETAAARQSEIERLTAELEKVTTVCESAQAEANALRAEVAQQRANFESAREEVSAQQQAALEAQQRIATLEAALNDAEGTIARHADTIASLEEAQQRIATLEATLSESECTITRHANSIASLEEAQDQLVGDLQRVTQERDQARAEAAAAGEQTAAAREESLALAQSEHASHQELDTALRQELDAANEEIEILAEKLRAANTQASPAEEDTRAETLQAALDALQLEHAEARDEIRSLKQALDAHRPGGAGIDAFDARGHKKRMGEILVEMGVLTEVQLKSILKEQVADPQRRLGALVVEHGLTSEDVVSRIIAAQLRLPYEDLTHVEPEPAAIDKVSLHVVRLHRCMPLNEDDGVLTVAMVNPLDLIAIEDLELASRCRVAPVVSTRSQIDALIESHYPQPK